MRHPSTYLRCCCCDSQAIGRQWWNRDTGFGLCHRCVDFNHADTGPEESRSFGLPGHHYATRLTATKTLGMIVFWQEPGQERPDRDNVGVLTAIDSSQATVTRHDRETVVIQLADIA